MHKLRDTSYPGLVVKLSGVSKIERSVVDPENLLLNLTLQQQNRLCDYSWDTYREFLKDHTMI